MEQLYDVQSLNEIVRTLLDDPATIHDLYGASLSQSNLKESISQYLPMVQYFIAKYIKGVNLPHPNSTRNKQTVAGKNKFANSTEMWNGRINSISDIEENMWSPWLGIKGKIDFTVKVVFNYLFLVFKHQ